jgi:hypothetical protein
MEDGFAAVFQLPWRFTMSVPCEKQCKTTEFFANLKCPNCFGKAVPVCLDDSGEPESGECTLCDCKFDLNPELKNIGME